MAGKNNVVIIKKVDGDGHGGHHGGAWKVAYADFMTAMMAFFLLMWILASSDQKAKRGLADYFTPSLSQAGGQGQGLLSGTVLGDSGILGGSDHKKDSADLPSFGKESPLIVFDSRLRDKTPKVVVEYEPVPEGTTMKDGKVKPVLNAKKAEMGLKALKEMQALKDKQAQRETLLRRSRKK